MSNQLQNDLRDDAPEFSGGTSATRRTIGEIIRNNRECLKGKGNRRNKIADQKGLSPNDTPIKIIINDGGMLFILFSLN